MESLNSNTQTTKRDKDSTADRQLNQSAADRFGGLLEELIEQNGHVGKHEAADVEAKKLGCTLLAELHPDLDLAGDTFLLVNLWKPI